MINQATITGAAAGVGRSAHRAAGSAAQRAEADSDGRYVNYGFTGVTLSSPVQLIPRGERIAGEFSCLCGPDDADDADQVHEDPRGFIRFTCGQVRLRSDGALRIQRLITPGFFRIAIRTGCMRDDGTLLGQINLGFYSDPEHCLGPAFRLNRLSMAEIAFPAIYLNGLDGELMLNGKLQSLG